MDHARTTTAHIGTVADSWIGEGSWWQKPIVPVLATVGLMIVFGAWQHVLFSYRVGEPAP
jgi:hypothetical protein